MRLNVTSFQPIVCSHFFLTPTSGDQQLEYESWGFIEVNSRRQQDRRGRNLQIEYAKCGVQIEYDST